MRTRSPWCLHQPPGHGFYRDLFCGVPTDHDPMPHFAYGCGVIACTLAATIFSVRWRAIQRAALMASPAPIP